MQHLLIIYSLAGDVAIIGYLVEAGADVNSKGDLYWSPLHFCAQNGNADAAAFLIEHDADVNFIDAYGATPLHVAALLGNWIII